jgi:hypothetical protein
VSSTTSDEREAPAPTVTQNLIRSHAIRTRRAAGCLPHARGHACPRCARAHHTGMEDDFGPTRLTGVEMPVGIGRLVQGQLARNDERRRCPIIVDQLP